MFEDLLDSGNFPYCSLFSGTRYSGRMYAAVNVADKLGAGLESTLVLSDRNNSIDIRAALNLYRKHRNATAADLLKRTVLTFLKQFHGALLDSQSQTGKRKFSEAGEAMDLLSRLPSLKEDDVPKWADSLESSLEKLYPSPNTQAVTIGKIRDIRRWCSEYSADGKVKVIIIEGIENSGESVSNSLLKILEEPPSDTYFILISSNPGRIGQTILSRVRHFVFPDMTVEEKNRILANLFVNPNDYRDLKSFFLTMSGTDDKLLLQSAEILSTGKKPDINALVQELEKNRTWSRFYELLTSEIRNRYNEGKISERKCSYLTEQIESMVSKASSFNQMNRLTFDFVLFRTLEVLS
jgi:DNA polymerase-3 subunit gamma/tau